MRSIIYESFSMLRKPQVLKRRDNETIVEGVDGEHKSWFPILKYCFACVKQPGVSMTKPGHLANLCQVLFPSNIACLWTVYYYYIYTKYITIIYEIISCAHGTSQKLVAMSGHTKLGCD